MKLKRFRILLIILLIASLLILNRFARGPIKNSFYIITSPVSKIFWRAGEIVSGSINTLFEINNLKIQNQQLFKQNLKLIQEINQLKHLYQENETLRKALGLELNRKFELTLTKIIAEDLNQDFILVLGGEDLGIKENMVVITEENVLVGKVSEVFSNFSKVKLITAKDFVFDVLIQKKGIQSEEEFSERMLGLAKGDGNLKLKLQLVPKEIQLKEKDIVKTTTLGGTFPEDLLVGEIKYLKKRGVEPYQEGEITPFFTKKQLQYLFFIKSPLPIK